MGMAWHGTLQREAVVSPGTTLSKRDIKAKVTRRPGTTKLFKAVSMPWSVPRAVIQPHGYQPGWSGRTNSS